MVELAGKVRVLRAVWSQAWGLMFRWPRGRFAYVFPFRTPRRIAVTMWFVFYPIDIVFLDANGRILELASNIRPFTHYFPKARAVVLLEFPAGTLHRHGVKVGQHLVWTTDSVRLRI